MKVEPTQQNDPYYQAALNPAKKKPNKLSVSEKIKTVAKIIFSVLLSLVLICINPAIFFISFLIGVAFNQTVQKAVEAIRAFISKYKWPVVAGSILATVFLLPVVLAAGSVIWSSYIGSYLSTKVQKQAHSTPPLAGASASTV